MELATKIAGLTSAEANRQLKEIGPNSIADQVHASLLKLAIRQFESPLVLILLFGAAVSLGLREWVDASIILAIVLGSTLIGFTQEYRASNAIADLRQRLALTARVLRDGEIRTLPTSQIVPGDVILLSAGNLIPADGTILEAKDFLVSEAALTGESFPVEKRPGEIAADTPMSARTNFVFLGTSVQSGTATVRVTETGLRTAFGAIVARLKSQPPETEFSRGIRHFGYLLLRVMVLIVLFVLTVNLLLGRPLVESLLFAVALAVGLSPELLPAIVSVTLSSGARLMARSGVIVRHLEAIENLGSIDVLCTDKTGTLTEGVVVLSDTTDPKGTSSYEIRQLAFLNAAFESGIENPLDAAIVAAGQKVGLTTDKYKKIDEIPYDFLRKRLTIVVAPDASPGRHQMIVKGAFSNVLDICTTIDRDGAATPLDDAQRAQLEGYYSAKGAEGFRVLAIATKTVDAKASYQRDDESDLSFVGFLLFFDPPKPEAQKTIRDLAALGINIKILTGDNRYVSAHIAEAIGLDPKSILTGSDIAKMKDESLWHLASQTQLFAEIDPQQKERIVRALQRTGHAVGYLGDGINDAPSLHAADVGISVDQAVDVARESADVILVERDLDVLRRGVEEGRRTFANTLKYITITTGANFGNMISMALATPLLPFLPLVAKQILLNNFLSDLPSIAISTDRVDADRIASAQRWKIGDIQKFMIVFGLISTAFDLVTFGTLLWIFGSDEAVFQTAWFTESLLTELAVLLVLRTRGPALKSRPSTLLLVSTLAITVMALAIPNIGPIARAFNFVPLSLALIVTVIGIVMAYVAATECAKILVFRYAHRNTGT